MFLGNLVMHLCDRDIELWLDRGDLLITPRPSTESINGITIDLHLWNKFRIFNEHTESVIDLSKTENELNSTINRVMSNEIELTKGEVFYLHQGELILGVTYEYIKMPENLVGWLDGRSSLARLGLMVHITAHRIDPGWSGHIVLECLNVGKLPIVLHPGIVIGALSFEVLTKKVMRPYNVRQNAKYLNQQGVVPSKIHKDLYKEK